MKTLTIDDLITQVPAAFASEPADTVSHRYSFIPTDRIVTDIMDRGWVPVRAFQSKRTKDTIHQWRGIHLKNLQQADFARQAIVIRNQGNEHWSSYFDPHNFLERRRPTDKSDDLWTVFNVVQENIMRGGVTGAVRTTKPITQVAEVQRINQELWQLTTEYGTLHGKN